MLILRSPKRDDPEVEFQYLDVNGIRLFCALREPPETRRRGTALLLHGFPEFWFAWKRQIPELARDWRVVAPDLRGYNLSEKPPGVEHYDIRALMADVLGLIEALGEEKVILVGHDWGGAIAWAFAAFHPERVEKLIVLNAPHPTTFAREIKDNPRQQGASQYIHLLRSERAAELLSRDDFELMRRFTFEAMIGERVMTERDQARYLEAWRQPGALDCSTHYYRAMTVVPPDFRRGEIKAHFDGPAPEIFVPVPTLVVWGEKDAALLPGLLDGLERYVPDLHIHRIPDATHWVHHERPDEVNRVIRAYLDA